MPEEPTAALRRELTLSFSDEELDVLCFDHFRPVYDTFGAGMTRTSKIQRLLEHCVRNRMLADLERHLRRADADSDLTRQRNCEIYTAIIKKWATYVDMDNWECWSSWVLGDGQPQLSVEQYTQLDPLRSWLLSRIWPGRYLELEAAFENFRIVLQDFLNTFRRNARKEDDSSMFRTEKFYRSVFVEQSVYGMKLREYDFHVDLVQDLMLELTRAANYICDHVRDYIIPSFRMEEGKLLVESGPHYSDLAFHKYQVEYRGEERTLRPYPGLETFKQIRTTRDVCFGQGTSPGDQEAWI